MDTAAVADIAATEAEERAADAAADGPVLGVPAPRTADDERYGAELDAVAERLHEEFDPRCGAEKVTAKLAEATDQFRSATVLTFVPVLIEREVRTALRAAS